MSSFQINVVINFIKRLSQAQRQQALWDLLSAFPDDWLIEALRIAQAVHSNRADRPPVPPHHVDPFLLGRKVP